MSKYWLKHMNDALRYIDGNLDGDFSYPKHRAVFTDSGTPGSIGDLQKRIFSEWPPLLGYEWTTSADIEVYLNDDTANMKYEVWSLLRKRLTQNKKNAKVRSHTVS